MANKITCSNLEEIILAVNELSEALYQSGYTGKAKCILSEDRNKTAGENAIAFVEQQADITGAALRMIAKATEIIADAFVNDEAAIVGTTEEYFTVPIWAENKEQDVVIPKSEVMAWVRK